MLFIHASVDYKFTIGNERVEDIEEKEKKNVGYQHLLLFKRFFLNPLPHMPILGSSNSATNKGMMSKTLTNGDTIF